MKAKTQKTAAPVVIAGILLLLFALISLDLYPTLSGNDDLVIGQRVDFQIATVIYLAGEVRDLKNRPDTHTQDISDLQVYLPVVQQVQDGLMNGDTSLGLPKPSDDVKRLLIRTQRDYGQVYAAMKALKDNADAPVADPIQVNIVLSHYLPYATAMSQLAQFLKDQAEATNAHLITIKISLKTLLILVIGGHYVLSGRKILDKLVEVEEGAQTPQGNDTQPLGEK